MQEETLKNFLGPEQGLVSALIENSLDKITIFVIIT